MVNFFFRRYLPGFRVNPQDDDVLGFNVDPQDDAPGFNIDENGGLQQDTTWSYGPPPGSVTPQDPDTTQMPTPVPGVDYPARPLRRRRFPIGLTSLGLCRRWGCRPYSIRAQSDPSRSIRYRVWARQRRPSTTRGRLSVRLNSKRCSMVGCSGRGTSGRTPPPLAPCAR